MLQIRNMTKIYLHAQILVLTVFVNIILVKDIKEMPTKYLTKYILMCFNKNRKSETHYRRYKMATDNEILELLEDQFEEMITEEDSWGYDFAEVYNVIAFKNINRAKEILTELDIAF